MVYKANTSVVIIGGGLIEQSEAQAFRRVAGACIVVASHQRDIEFPMTAPPRT